MENKFRVEILAWLLLPFFCSLFLAVHPRSNAVNQFLNNAHRAILNQQPLNASANLASVAERLPWRNELWDIAGRMAQEGRQWETAIQYFEVAVARDQISAVGYLSLGDAYYQAGNISQALDAWQRALQMGASPMEVHTRAFHYYQSEKMYAEAIEELRVITALEPTNAQLRYRLGLMLATKEPEAALAYLIQAMELNEELTESVQHLQKNIKDTRFANDPAYTLLNAGRALAFLNEWELAVEAFREATRINPNYAEAWAFLGEAYQHLDKDGLPELQHALSLGPDSLTVNILSALYWKRQENYAIALEYLEKASRLDPMNPAVHSEIGSTYNEMGDFNAALTYFKRATELASEDPTFWHLLAQFSFQNNTQVEDLGLHAARQALMLNENDPISLDLMGYGYYLLEDKSNARRFLERALEIDSDYPPANLHIGLLNFSQGDSVSAKGYFQRTIDLAPETSAGIMARRILEKYYP